MTAEDYQLTRMRARARKAHRRQWAAEKRLSTLETTPEERARLKDRLAEEILRAQLLESLIHYREES